MEENWQKGIERARQMTPDERFREGLRLFEQGHNYIVRSIRDTFPEAAEEDVRRIRDVRRAKAWGIT